MEFKMSNFFCFKKRVDPKVTQIKLWDKAPLWLVPMARHRPAGVLHALLISLCLLLVVRVKGSALDCIPLACTRVPARTAPQVKRLPYCKRAPADLRHTQVQESAQASGLENASANGTHCSSPVFLPTNRYSASGDDCDFDTTCSGD